MIITSIFVIWKINNETLFLCLFISSLWLVDTSNITSIWLLIEMQTLSLILIIYLNEKTSYLNMESIFKYMIMSVLFSIFILLYIISEYSASNNIFLKSYSVISFLTLIAFSLKIGIFPLHIWIPEVYLGITLDNIFVIGFTPKIIMYLVWSKIYMVNDMFYTLILLSLIFSCIAGLNQSNLKMILAYSSIYNISFIFFSFFIVSNICNIYSYTYFLIYFFTNTIILLCLKKIITDKYQLIYLINSNKKINILISISLFSLIGIPPLAGFFIKVFFLKQILYNKMILLSLIIILTTIVSSFYYLRIIKTLYDINSLNLNHWANISSKISLFKNKRLIFVCIYIIIAVIYSPNFLIIILNYIYL